jgi:hypothetical protein
MRLGIRTSLGLKEMRLTDGIEWRIDGGSRDDGNAVKAMARRMEWNGARYPSIGG